jgi:hypothetical protein
MSDEIKTKPSSPQYRAGYDSINWHRKKRTVPSCVPVQKVKGEIRFVDPGLRPGDKMKCDGYTITALGKLKDAKLAAEDFPFLRAGS